MYKQLCKREEHDIKCIEPAVIVMMRNLNNVPIFLATSRGILTTSSNHMKDLNAGMAYMRV